jgi:hypothetical protein
MTAGPQRQGRAGPPAARQTAPGRLRTLTRREVRLLGLALAEILRARAGLTLHRHAALRARIARLASEAAPAPPARAALAEVGWSVAAAARAVPGASCLTQALAGQALLARRGIGSRIEVSLPDGAGGFRPHAWLIAGDVVILGGTAADRAGHRLLATYAVEGAQG